MKKFVLLFIAVAFSSLSVISQEVVEDYSRSAVTLKLLDYDQGKYQDSLRQKFQKVQVSDKFDNNNLESKLVKASVSRNASHEQKIEAIIEQLESQNSGSQIVAKWFNRQPDGTMNMDLIHKRGLYNAQDADVLEAKASKRGRALLKDMGMKLLKKSYIVVIDYQRIQDEDDLDIDDQHGWKTPLNVYLFKVKFGPEEQAVLFDDMWVYEDDDEATKEEKKKKFEEYTFEIEHVMTQENPTDLSRMQFNEDTDLGQFIPQKSNEQLFKELVHKGVERAFFLLEKNHEDFRVKTPIYARKPIQAKIGKKEGLKIDQRYLVYEYIYNEDTKEAEPKRKGAIRTKDVVDNREVASGETPTSEFYQISGGKLEKGMILAQKSDWGFGIQGRYQNGPMGGGGLKVSYNLAQIMQSPQFKVYGSMSIDFGGEFESDYFTSNEFSFTRYSVGLAKGYYFARMFSIEPFVGYGYESATASDLTFDDMNVDPPEDYEGDDSFDVNVMMLDVGADFGISVAYWMKLIVGIEYHTLISNAINADSDTYLDSSDDPIKYTDFFEDQKGMSVNMGLHIEF